MGLGSFELTPSYTAPKRPSFNRVNVRNNGCQFVCYISKRVIKSPHKYRLKLGLVLISALFHMLIFTFIQKYKLQTESAI